MKKNALIIGHGSIGKRHYKILKKLDYFKTIFYFSKRNLSNKNKKIYVNSIKDLKHKNIKYIVIASRTEDHLFFIEEIERNFKNLNVLVEKPLFEKYYNINPKKNNYFVGYNLRYHPIVLYLKKIIKNKKIIFFDIKCISYLPVWRNNLDYIHSNSAGYGGGALLELSHELDYAQYIFGNIKKIYFNLVNKISNIKIKKDDNVILFGKSSKANFSINLNFFSHSKERKITIHMKKLTIISDLIKNQILFYKNHKITKKIKFKIKDNQTYMMQHKNTLLGKNNCNYKYNLKLMKLIDKLKK